MYKAIGNKRMKTYIDCIPCFAKQTLEAVRMATKDEKVHEQLLRSIFRMISEMDLGMSPPEMGQMIHREIRRHTGNGDPYQSIKSHFNQIALKMYDELANRLERSPNKFEAAARLSIAGNMIDSALINDLSVVEINHAANQALYSDLEGDCVAFKEAILKAKDILFIADNAGEIVFDRLLIEYLPLEKITLVVRGKPILNDATLEDAATAGLNGIVRVIDNGSDAPGTILSDCSESFQTRFQQADLIIAKGQGNYETLSHIDKNIFFLLKAKCPVIARDIGCRVGSMVIHNVWQSSQPLEPISQAKNSRIETETNTMPNKDGTGPAGQGPITGRGEGQCQESQPDVDQINQNQPSSGRGQRQGRGRGQGQGGGRGQGRGGGRGQRQGKQRDAQ